MVGLLDLPLELLEEIAHQSIGTSKEWCPRSTACSTELSLRLVHPHLTPAFTLALFQSCKLVLNPRHSGSVSHLINFIDTHQAARHLTSLEIMARNFLQRTHKLNEQISDLVARCHHLANLELFLDGHFVHLAEFPVMPSLKRICVQGESVYANIGSLADVAPNLVCLELLAPCFSGHRVSEGTAPPSQGRLSNVHFGALPASLSQVHIANLNTPSGQALLQALPFLPIHFSYTLIHNYDLLELVLLLCREAFCRRLVTLSLSSTSFVAPLRLLDFKQSMLLNMAAPNVQLHWSDSKKEIVV